MQAETFLAGLKLPLSDEGSWPHTRSATQPALSNFLKQILVSVCLLSFCLLCLSPDPEQLTMLPSQGEHKTCLSQVWEEPVWAC